MDDNICNECGKTFEKSDGWRTCNLCLHDRGTRETRTYTVNGSIRNLNELEKLFGCMYGLGITGSTQDIEIFYDGDGSAFIEFERTDKQSTIIENEVEKIDDRLDNIIEEDDKLGFSFE